jgi:TrmH family RNA methyltransferase
MTVISSPANPQFKSLRLLTSSASERRRASSMVLDGPHLLACYLARLGAPETVAVSEDALERPEIAQLLQRCGDARLLLFSPRLFARLAPVEHPVGILAIAPVPRPSRAAGVARVSVLLEGVQDPGNVGGIVRTAAAAGVEEVLLSAGCADPWAPRTLRAGMGGHFVLDVRSAVDLPAALDGFDGTVVMTVARGGCPPQEIDLTGPIAFVLGGEGAGLSEALQSRAGARITIPMAPGIESLNVGVAAAVLLYERVRQLATPNRR